ncbi:hypothetical protein K435DRAFT_837766 [Dendrothele bispora CBS 962.96]|uniref:Nephrocystin 3-like N-terminal domain-containing protein n=1 Tax=Dendrothele bispora (strain CBS 962.96) TaxID=1314807 RepID=A0A4V6T5I3_DENBC|nr:hypothetical protein K435DRAFT_837766 [Dendrothele bispora CBS 962.96]
MISTKGEKRMLPRLEQANDAEPLTLTIEGKDSILVHDFGLNSEQPSHYVDIQVKNLPFGKTMGSYVVIKHRSDKYKTTRLDAKNTAVQWNGQFKINDGITGIRTPSSPFFFKCIPRPSRLLGASQIEICKLTRFRGQGVEVVMNDTNIKLVIIATNNSDNVQEDNSTARSGAAETTVTQGPSASNGLQIQIQGAASESDLHTPTRLINNTNLHNDPEMLKPSSLQIRMQSAAASEPDLHPPTRPIDNPNLHNEMLQASFLSKVMEVADPVMKVLEGLAQVHPIAEIALIAVSGIYKIVKAIENTHQEIVVLYKTMFQTYQVAVQNDSLTETLRNDSNFQDIFDSMVKHSMDCYMFISDFQSKSLVSRMFCFDTAQKIGEYIQVFEDLEAQLTGTQIKVTAVSLLKITPAIEEINFDSKLKLLNVGNTLRPKSRCLPGTRRATIRKIMNWTVSGEESVFLAVRSSRLWEELFDGNFAQHSRLAAFIRFDRNDYNDASMFIRTLAYKLARFDHRLGQAIVDELTKNEQIVDVTELSTQFNRLILEPLRKHQQDLRNGGSIVIIVDGLDECTRSDRAETDFRGQLLQLLIDNPFRLFPFVRLVLASRPEEDIKQMLTAQKHIVAFPLDISSAETEADIKCFLEHKLSEVDKRHPESRFLELCREKDAINQLSIRASGLFIWVSTVVSFVANYPARLQRILDTDVPKDALKALTTLYQTALESIAGEDGDADIRADIRSVLGRIMASNFLTPVTLNGPFTGTDSSDAFRPDRTTHVFEKLWSLIQKDDDTQRLSLLHKSFDDFLTDELRSREYYIDVKDYVLDWATTCTSYFINFLEKNIEHPRKGDPGAAFHEFAMISWDLFLKKLTFQDLESRPGLPEILTTMLQKYLLRLIILGPYLSGCLGRIVPQYLENKTENASDFEQLMRDSSEFITPGDQILEIPENLSISGEESSTTGSEDENSEDESTHTEDESTHTENENTHTEAKEQKKQKEDAEGAKGEE